MGNFWNPRPVVGARIDDERTKKAEALADKYRAELDKIHISGTVVFAKQGSEEYHAIRSSTFAFNDGGYPFAIFVPNSVEDVSKIVKGLNGLNLDVAIAGGKHSPMAMPDGAVVIDLDRMRSITVDVEKRILDCAGGCRITDIDAKLSELKCDLGFVTGTNGDTGVAGLTLVGGWGWLSRKHGMAVDNFIEAEIVLADGRIVTCNDNNEYKMLMRALRGGGGNFGIVTRFRFILHDVSQIIGGSIARFCPTYNSAKLVAQAFRDINLRAPDKGTGGIVFPFGAPVTVTMGFYCADKAEQLGDPKTGTPYLQELTAIKGQWFNLQNDIRKMDYHQECQKLLEEQQQRNFMLPTGYYIRELTDEIIDVLLHYSRSDYVNKKGAIIAVTMGGQIKVGNPDRPSAMAHRNNGYWLILEPTLRSNEPEEIALHANWALRVKDAIRKAQGDDVAQSPHMWFEGPGEEEKQHIYVYRGEIKQFLAEAKAKYDPRNFFHMNSNILPASSAVSRS